MAAGDFSSARVDEVVESFRSKYGTRDVEAYYPKHDVALEVALGGSDLRGDRV